MIIIKLLKIDMEYSEEGYSQWVLGVSVRKDALQS